MATLTSGNTLSLNGLASATGQATKSLSAAKGNTTGPIAMSSFAIDSVGSVSGYTYAVEGTTETYTLGFSGDGANFNRISGRAANFTWSVPAGSYITLGTNSGASCTFNVSNMNPQSPSSQAVLQSIQSNTIRCVFNDGFNDHIGIGNGYGANKDKTVYSVDSYDGNSVALCLTSDSPIIMADGSIKEIGEIEEGDVLKGYSIGGLDENSDGTFYDWSTSNLNTTAKNVTVVNVVYSFTGKYYSINNGQITATSEHPLLVKELSSGDYKFKQVFLLEVGDKLVKSTESGLEEIDITSIVIENETTEIVSIDVEENDTYLVNGYITHNKGGNSHSDLGTPSAPTGLAYSSPRIDWTAVTGTGSTGVTAYDVQIDNNSDFSSPTLDYAEWSTTGLEVNSLLSAGTYYCRVRAIDHGLKSNWSSTLTFNR
jgi:hypothetical protein